MNVHSGAHVGPLSQTEIQKDVREAQRRWLDELVDFTKRPDRPRGLSLTQIARLSGLADSTLTRFRNAQSYEGALSPMTIRKIEIATGFPAPLSAIGEEAGLRAAFREPEASPYQPSPQDPFAAAIKLLIADRRGVDPWTLKSRALEYEGFKPGDILVVNMNAEPRAGDIVCAQIYDFEQGRADTVFRLFEPPFLLGAGPDEAHRRPIRADEGHVAIKGVVETTFRRRTARSAA